MESDQTTTPAVVDVNVNADNLEGQIENNLKAVETVKMQPTGANTTPNQNFGYRMNLKEEFLN
jgi:hypothetical protein